MRRICDELAYFDPGFMGNQELQTPNLDQMAREGIIFRNMLAGGPSCAPTRCTLLTGKHAGHCSVRENSGDLPIRADEETIGSVLKRQGYATGGFGKWGIGGRGSTGVPEKHGSDVFFGYYDQVHAHTYYPPYLIRNSEEVDSPIYQDKDWSKDKVLYAGMTTMLDRQVGEVLVLLKELGAEKNTLVFFSGDNGGAGYGNGYTNPQTGHVQYRGSKGQIYEGAFRVPFIAHWPGKIQSGRISDHLGYFPDVLPTLAELTGAEPPSEDGQTGSTGYRSKKKRKPSVKQP